MRQEWRRETKWLSFSEAKWKWERWDEKRSAAEDEAVRQCRRTRPRRGVMQLHEGWPSHQHQSAEVMQQEPGRKRRRRIQNMIREARCRLLC